MSCTRGRVCRNGGPDIRPCGGARLTNARTFRRIPRGLSRRSGRQRDVEKRWPPISWNAPAFICSKRSKATISPFWPCHCCLLDHLRARDIEGMNHPRACIMGHPVAHSRSRCCTATGCAAWYRRRYELADVRRRSSMRSRGLISKGFVGGTSRSRTRRRPPAWSTGASAPRCDRRVIRFGMRANALIGGIPIGSHCR